MQYITKIDNGQLVMNTGHITASETVKKDAVSFVQGVIENLKARFPNTE
jgi:hypothetical protein